MRYVAVKSEQKQAASVVFRARDLLFRQRTQVINSLRGHLAEYGLVAAHGPSHVARLIEQIEDPDSVLPNPARVVLRILVDTVKALEEKIASLDAEITRRAREDEDTRDIASPNADSFMRAELRAFGSRRLERTSLLPRAPDTSAR